MSSRGTRPAAAAPGRPDIRVASTGERCYMEPMKPKLPTSTAPRTKLSPLFAALAAIALAAPTLAPAEADQPWPVTGEGLEPDPSVVWGQLDNGFRYALMPNNEPPDRVSLRLFVDAGSLMEEDHEQGLAHFLEHMAFNGTKHFKPGEMVEYFQRLGMAFGADTNAHTSFKETVYKLELPDGSSELLEEGLLLFSDYAGRMLLLGHEIEKERGVILAEKLSRDSVQYRTMVEGFKFALPDALLSQRMPIGTEEVIRNADRQTFIDFFLRWYTPDRMLLIAVGNIDPGELETMVVEKFGALPGRERQPDPDMGEVTTGRGLVAHLHTEPEMAQLEISVEALTPARDLPDTAANRKADLVRGLGDRMLNRRFSRIVQGEDSPITGAQAYHYEYLGFVRNAGISLNARPERWHEAVALAETEVRRVLEHGFTESELREAVANTLREYRNRAEQAGTRRSIELANQLGQVFARQRVWTHPQGDFELASAALDEVTADEVLAAFRDDWATDDITLFIGGNLELEDPAQQITGAWRGSSEQAVDAPEDTVGEEFAYTDFGLAGQVVERIDHDDLGITQVRFENHVRLNVMATEFEENSARVLVNVGAGRLGAPQDKPGLLAFAQHTFELGGLEAHSRDELQGLLAGRTVGLDISIGDDAMTLGGRTTGEDLLLQLQLLAAYVTAPGYRGEGERLFREQIDAIYNQLENTAEGVFQEQVGRFLRNDDPRFGFGPRESIAELTMDDVRGLLAQPLAEGYVEISVVGDVDVDQVIAQVAATFGALPERAAAKTWPEGADQLALPEGGTSRVFDYETSVPRSVVAIYWPTGDMWDIERTRRMNVVGEVLSDRIRRVVREELGDAYSPAAYHTASDAFADYGYVVAVTIVAPGQAERVAEVMEEIAAGLAAEGVDQDEFQRAMEPMMTQVRQLRRDNRYWMNSVLRTSQQHPQRLDWARGMIEDLEAITPDEISELAAEFLPSERRILVKAMPVVTEEAGAPGEPAAGD